ILGDDGYRRTALLVGADGVAARYDKMRLVPFGEYVPLRGLLGWVTGQTAAPQIDLVRGREQAVLEVAGARVGALISYESQFPDLRRRLAGMGAEAIVALGSMSGFHGTWAQPQQASIEAVRAVESGRAGLQSSLNGISVAFDANGEALLWVAPHERGAYTIDLPLRRGPTPYVRFGDWVPALSGAILLTAGALVGRARLSGR
ncbi:MAG TPA: apolipoprotein N-acyltransferase, partial [Egibacteraceae bacterium]|nr:apolipoprotein N-acyltransferase [Egibacteraceae bacterium]